MWELRKMQARSGVKKYGPFSLLMLLVVLLLIYCGFIYAIAPQKYLVVEAPKENQYLYSIPVESSDYFEMTYTHSVTKQTVQGLFIITELGEIKPHSTTFDSFGPGLPELDGSLEYEITDGKFVVYHDDEPREEISLFVSPLTGDRLYLHGQKYDLTSHFEKPILLRIYITAK